MPPNKSEIDQEIMLRLSNDLIRIEMVINRLEHDRIDMLQNGDPVISDQDLSRLNILGCEISVLKRELEAKTMRLKKMKKKYFQMISRKLGCRIRLK